MEHMCIFFLTKTIFFPYIKVLYTKILQYIFFNFRCVGIKNMCKIFSFCLPLRVYLAVFFHYIEPTNNTQKKSFVVFIFIILLNLIQSNIKIVHEKPFFIVSFLLNACKLQLEKFFNWGGNLNKRANGVLLFGSRARLATWKWIKISF